MERKPIPGARVRVIRRADDVYVSVESIDRVQLWGQPLFPNEQAVIEPAEMGGVTAKVSSAPKQKDC
jgi:hypothetical protein